VGTSRVYKRATARVRVRTLQYKVNMSPSTAFKSYVYNGGTAHKRGCINIVGHMIEHTAHKRGCINKVGHMVRHTAHNQLWFYSLKEEPPELRVCRVHHNVPIDGVLCAPVVNVDGRHGHLVPYR
jgi:hypothetical protein